MDPVGRDVDAADSRHQTSRPTPDRVDRNHGPTDGHGVTLFQGDPEAPDSAPVEGEVSIPEIEAEQVPVRVFIDRRTDASPRIMGTGDADGSLRVWYGGWDSNPQALAGSRV